MKNLVNHISRVLYTDTYEQAMEKIIKGLQDHTYDAVQRNMLLSNYPQDFLCDFIHGLHLCDNFGAFYINIDNFIGKNSEKITKNYPSISYIKVKTPKIELVISLEPS